MSPHNNRVQTLQGGFWRLDGGYKATLQLDNKLINNDLTVTPSLYLADGSVISLDPLVLRRASVRTISIAEELRRRGVSTSQINSSYGSVSLTFQWAYPSAVGACIENLDVGRSLISNFSLRSAVPASSTLGPTRVSSLWWKQTLASDAVFGVVNVSNRTVNYTFSLLDGHGNDAGSRQLTLAPKATAKISANLPELSPSKNAGSIRILSDASQGSLMVYGTLEDVGRGFSLTLPTTPLLPKPKTVRSDQPDRISFASPGLMIGRPDPMMSFTHLVQFSPVYVVSNLSSDTRQITIRASALKSAPVPVADVALQPGETKVVDLSRIQGNISKSATTVNLIADWTGLPHDVLLSSASIDTSQSYVFQVKPDRVMPAMSKEGQYWRAGGGDDSMISVWNELGEPQAVDIQLIYDTGHYRLPYLLAPYENAEIDIGVLIRLQTPDINGNRIPAGFHEGKVIIAAPGNDDDTNISIAATVGTFNIKNATCGDPCVNCQGYTDFYLSPSTLILPNTTSGRMHGMAVKTGGLTSDFTSKTTWSTDNAPVATVSSGSVTGKSVGKAIIDGAITLLGSHTYCEDQDFCGGEDFEETGPANVVNLLCTPATRGSITTCTAYGPSGTTFSSWAFSDGTSVVTSANGSGVNTWTGTAVTSGVVTVTAKMPDGSASQLTAPLAVIARSGWAFSAQSPSQVGTITSCTGAQPPVTPTSTSLTGAACIYGAASYMYQSIAGGPNQGYSYITAKPSDTGSFTWTISADIQNTGSSFYKAQCGNYNAATNSNGYISGATLNIDTVRHESGTVNSHYTNYVNNLQTPANNIGVQLEGAVAAPGQSENTLASNAITSAAASLRSADTEPCGTHSTNLNASCVLDGYVNFSPYAVCQ